MFCEWSKYYIISSRNTKKNYIFPAEIQKQATTSDHDVHTWQQVAWLNMDEFEINVGER